MTSNSRLEFLEMAYFYAELVLRDMYLQCIEHEDYEPIPSTYKVYKILFNSCMSQI